MEAPPIKHLLRWLRRHGPAIALLALYWGMATTATRRKCATSDEQIHVAGGYSYWLAGDFRLHPENGNLPQRLVALPSLASRLPFPRLDTPDWRRSKYWTIALDFFYESGNDPDRILWWSRSVVAVAGAVLGWVVYRCARHAFGAPGGLISLAVFAFSPTMLSHGALATSDMVATLLLFVSALAFWRALHTLSPRTLACSSLAVGALFTAKMSAPAFLPVAAVMASVRLFAGPPIRIRFRNPLQARRPRARVAALGVIAAAHALAIWLVVWTAFEWRFSAFNPVYSQPPHDHLHRGWEWALSDSGTLTSAVRMARDARILPEAFLFGFAHVLRSRRYGFMNGRLYDGGTPAYFPFAFAVKTPLGLWVLALLAGVAIAVRCRHGGTGRSAGGGRPPGGRVRSGLYRATPLLSLFGVYWVFALTSGINIGIRHILPVFPPLFVMVGAAGRWLTPKRRRREGAQGVPALPAGSPVGRGGRPVRAGDSRAIALGALTVAALGWLAFESLRIRPHYLAYFNQLAGGPEQAHKVLVDSCLDWGQDLPGLRDWLARHGIDGSERAPVYLGYFGHALPRYYGIPGRHFLYHSKDPEHRYDAFLPLGGGTYCIGATMLQNVYGDDPRRWSPEAERQFRRVLEKVRAFRDAQSDPEARRQLIAKHGAEYWDDVRERFTHMRLSRLFTYLRRRGHDAHVGYSILIYRLTDEEVEEALHGPPPSDRDA